MKQTQNSSSTLKRNWPIFIILFVLFLCLTDALYSQVYFPLKIGNRWDYEEQELNFHDFVDTISIIVIRDTIMSNGKSYFVLSRGDVTNERFVRADSEYVYYFDTYDSKEDTVYHLRATLNQYWNTGIWSVYQGSLQSIFNENVFGFSTRVLSYNFLAMYDRSSKLSEKFGPISFNILIPGGRFYAHSLIGCIISDTVFGQLLTNVKEHPQIPSRTELLQNYPNPFNPITRIPFSLSTSAHVNVSVYNLLGQKVTTLIDSWKSVGEYAVEWDALNFPSGVYIVCFNTLNGIQSRKLILQR